MYKSQKLKPVEILLIEDNPGDVRLIKEGLKENKVLNNLNVVKDGEKAIEFLKREGIYSQAPVPELIILDLNLPRKNGKEVLEYIKTNDELKLVPVVVLTSSKAEEDIISSYELNANCYITKPVNLDDFISVVKSIEFFWLCIVKLPGEEQE